MVIGKDQGEISGVMLHQLIVIFIDDDEVHPAIIRAEI